MRFTFWRKTSPEMELASAKTLRQEHNRCAVEKQHQRACYVQSQCRAERRGHQGPRQSHVMRSYQ
jgi:hypothetical protein